MKQVIVMRTDLNMRKGKMVAQGAHASMKVVLENMENPYVIKWLDNSFTKVVVQVKSEEELLEIKKRAHEVTSLVAIITDNGATEFNNVKTNTCLAIGPLPEEMFVGLTDHLKLL